MSPYTSEPAGVVSSNNTAAITRRDVVKSTALLAAALIPVSNLYADHSASSDPLTSEKLAVGSEHFRGSLGGARDVWCTDMLESTVWKQVEVPHCFNARDAVDPDQPYYEGPGWYRRKLRVRNPDELKLVKVYSNCETVELFLNGVSQGVKRRNSQDFPAAGLHWAVKFKPGENRLKAVGHMKTQTVEDGLAFQYQMDKWGAPARVPPHGILWMYPMSSRITPSPVSPNHTRSRASRHRTFFASNNRASIFTCSLASSR